MVSTVFQAFKGIMQGGIEAFKLACSVLTCLLFHCFVAKHGAVVFVVSLAPCGVVTVVFVVHNSLGGPSRNARRCMNWNSEVLTQWFNLVVEHIGPAKFIGNSLKVIDLVDLLSRRIRHQ